ncbi:MAG: hypothetical protein AAF710_07125 [Planctomycetota bacterium]
MLSVSLIERSLAAGDHDRLLRDLADNGQPLPLGLRLRLGRGPAAPLGLALRRLVELTYAPTPLSLGLTRRLLDLQDPDGHFGDPRNLEDPRNSGNPRSSPDPLATAAALAGLARVRRDHASDRVPAGLDERLAAGYAALAAMQGGDGLLTDADDRSAADRARTTAFAVALLGEDPAFRAAFRLADALAWFDAQDGRLDRHTTHLWDLARLAVAESHGLGVVAAA